MTIHDYKTRNTSIRRSPRRGKQPVELTTGKHKKSIPARKSLNGKLTGSKNSQGVTDGASGIPVVNTVAKKRIVSLTIQKKKRKSVPTRARSMFVPSQCESSNDDNNDVIGDDNNDDKKTIHDYINKEYNH